MTFFPGYAILIDESEYHFSAPAAVWAMGENRESGENPERYRHCECGAEPGAKAGHWETEKAAGEGADA